MMRISEHKMPCAGLPQPGGIGQNRRTQSCRAELLYTELRAELRAEPRAELRAEPNVEP